MTSSREDNGLIGYIVGLLLLVLIGFGLFAFTAYRRMLTKQMMIEEIQRQEMFQQAENAKAAAQQAGNAAPSDTAQQSASFVTTATASQAEEEIRAKIEAQQAAWNKGDLDAFMIPYWKSDQLTFSSGGKTTRGWQATLDGYKSKYSTPEKIGKLTFGGFGAPAARSRGHAGTRHVANREGERVAGRELLTRLEEVR